MNLNQISATGPRFLSVVLLAMTMLKLGLMGSGLFAFEDEGRYTNAARALKNFAHGRISAGLEEVFSTQGRPGDTLVHVIPNALQFLTSRVHGVHIYAPSNTYPLFLFNFVVFLLLLMVLYRYALVLLRSRDSALLAVLLYSSLLNPQLYLRHAVPYDLGLLVLLFVLGEFSRRAEEDAWSPPAFLTLGVAACFGCAIYPGYYPIFLVAGAVLLLANWKKATWIARSWCVAAYIVGGFGCLVSLEALSRVGGRSYLKELSTLSGQITQGSFDEMLTYGLKYLLEVERWGGLVVLAGVVGCMWQFGRTLRSGSWREEWRVLLPLGLVGVGFLAYAAAGYFLHKMVFYGRLLHQYYPFVCIAVAYGVDGLLLRRRSATRWMGIGVAVCASVFLANWVSLLRLAYPGDVSFRTAQTYQFAEVLHVCEFENSFSLVVSPDLFLQQQPGAPKASGIRTVLVNPCVYWPPRGPATHHPFVAGPQDHLILDLPHFLGHPAYRYEGFSPQEREMIRKAALRIRLYTRL